MIAATLMLGDDRTIMKLRIRIGKHSLEAIIQYALIVLCIIAHNTWFYSLNDIYFRFGIICISLFFVIIKRKIYYKNLYLIFALIFVSIIVMETIFSGVNNYLECLYIFMFIIEPILITIVAVDYNREMYITRYVKTVIFMSLISLVFYLYSNINFNGFLNSGLIDQIEGLRITFTEYYGNIFYCMRYREPYKNLGPFCEPGLFQIVISAAIYLLIFYYNKVQIKHRILFLLLLIVTLITTRSATGYLSLMIILGSTLVSKRSVFNKKIKRALSVSLIILIILVVTDFTRNGVESIVYTFLIEKIFGINSNEITTGSVRMTTIIECIKLIIINPLGYGYTYVSNIFSLRFTEAVGATLFRTMAMIGLVPIVLLLSYFFKKAYRSRISLLQYTVLILLYFNTALAQSREFYPAYLALFLLNSNYKKLIQTDINTKCLYDQQ